MPGAEQVLTGLVAHARERHVAREQESPAPASLI
jgi:hypothetical protein